MPTLSAIAAEETDLSTDDVEWLRDLVREGQLVADLALSDIALWLRTRDGGFICAALFRPGNANTIFYRDIVRTHPSESWKSLLSECLRRGTIIEADQPIWIEETANHVRAIPVRRRSGDAPIAVMTRHALLVDYRSNRQAQTFIEASEQIFGMIAEGEFPDAALKDAPKLGQPRASDGFIRLDRSGIVTYASPNALSSFNRMGHASALEGLSLADVARKVSDTTVHGADESLALIVGGKVPWRADFRAAEMTLAVRSIPITQHGERIGSLVLLREVSEIRRQQRELVSKNATIREIHHRVKNNLQTVSSLLRIQGRRSKSEDVKDALSQAMRRVEAIAVVHDALASGLAQTVDFDDVATRVVPLAAEVAGTSGPLVRPKLVGSFGDLPSEFATPLAVVLTELISNAVEHGLKDKTDGVVTVRADRSVDHLRVTVSDNGCGFDSTAMGLGLGTQIVRALVENELSATIDWRHGAGGGTDVVIDVPLKFIAGPARG
jgi:two-component sensor histidine kinase